MKEGRKPEYPEKSRATSFRICHVLKPEDSSPKCSHYRATHLALQDQRCGTVGPVSVYCEWAR